MLKILQYDGYPASNLCGFLDRLGLKIDPGSLQVERWQISSEKLAVDEITMQCSTLLTNFTNSIVFLPLLSTCELYNYLLSFDDCTLASCSIPRC